MLRPSNLKKSSSVTEIVRISLFRAFNRHDQRLTGEVEQFSFPFAKASLNSWNPKGEIFGSAQVEWKVSEEFQIHADTSFRELEFGGIHFGQGKNLKCFFSSAFGLSIEGLEFNSLPKVAWKGISLVNFITMTVRIKSILMALIFRFLLRNLL